MKHLNNIVSENLLLKGMERIEGSDSFKTNILVYQKLHDGSHLLLPYVKNGKKDYLLQRKHIQVLEPAEMLNYHRDEKVLTSWTTREELSPNAHWKLIGEGIRSVPFTGTTTAPHFESLPLVATELIKQYDL